MNLSRWSSGTAKAPGANRCVPEYPGSRLDGRLYSNILKMTIEALNGQINSPTEDK